MPLDNLVDGFVRNTAERARSLVGTVVSKVSDKYDARGPLAVFNQNKFQISKMQYPLNLGEAKGSGPHLAYIKFNILESVGVEGQSSGEFAGAANLAKRNSSVEKLVNEAVNLVGGVGSLLSDVIGPNTAEAAKEVGNFIQATNLSPSQFTSQRRVRKTTQVIALYMPHTMVFSQTNSYNDYSYTQQLGAALLAGQALSSVSKGDISGVGTAATEAVSRVALDDQDRAALLYGFQGKALNPQIEVIYQETPLRTFQFEFVLAARSRAENEAIQQIITAFRKAAAPSFDGGPNAGPGRYLIPPDEFDIEFYFDQRQMKTLPRISTCVLTSIITDFAPSGQSTFFEDGSPMSVRLALEFKEVEIITKQRIAQGGF